MTSLRKRVLSTLGMGKPVRRVALSGGSTIDWFEIPIQPWTEARFDTNADDCNKRSSLLNGVDGSMSCLEVEVVRRLRDGDNGINAGWVQAWRCGANSWSRWIWKDLPTAFAKRNQAIQAQRGRKSTDTGGHPDIAVVLGDAVFYVECKVDDPVDKQLDWISIGVANGVISADDVVVVQGVFSS